MKVLIKYNKEKHYLTPTKLKILKLLFEQGLKEGGTKLIQFKLEHIQDKEYKATTFERYAKCTREFDLRPESKIARWHNEGTQTIFVTIQN